MDGVLVNSIEIIWSAFTTLLKDYDVHFSEEYIKRNLATSLRDNLKNWKEEFGIGEQDLAEFSKKSATIQLEFLKQEKVDPNLLILLEQAKKHGVKLAVATSSTRWRTEEILSLLAIRDFFEVVVTAENVDKHKPAPDVFLKAAELLNVHPTDCVVIEDAVNGIQAAKSAQTKVIGLATKYCSALELKQADLIINNFSEINLEKIKKLGK